MRNKSKCTATAQCYVTLNEAASVTLKTFKDVLLYVAEVTCLQNDTKAYKHTADIQDLHEEQSSYMWLTQQSRKLPSASVCLGLYTPVRC